jgi:hypothetical protein
MAGQHIEREARYEQTRLSPAQRDATVWDLKHRGYSYAQIGKRLGMSKSACKYIFDRLSGTPRIQKQSAMCQGCWRDVYRDQLTNSLCPECADGDAEKSPPEAAV